MDTIDVYVKDIWTWDCPLCGIINDEERYPPDVVTCNNCGTDFLSAISDNR